jgi:hypothetical protein
LVHNIAPLKKAHDYQSALSGGAFLKPGLGKRSTIPAVDSPESRV